MAKMIAYFGDPELKAERVARMQAHIAADELIHGYYWESGKGCAVGCSTDGHDHLSFEREMGIPQILARLDDVHFERLENYDARKWAASFLDSIPVGSDLSMVWPKYAVWMLGGLPKSRRAAANDAVEAVKALYEEWISSGVRPQEKRWRAAAYGAYAADAAANAAAAKSFWKKSAAKILELLRESPVELLRESPVEMAVV